MGVINCTVTNIDAAQPFRHRPMHDTYSVLAVTRERIGYWPLEATAKSRFRAVSGADVFKGFTDFRGLLDKIQQRIALVFITHRTSSHLLCQTAFSDVAYRIAKEEFHPVRPATGAIDLFRLDI